MDQKSLEQEEKIYNDQVNQTNEKLKATHEKREYTFSVVEKRRLTQQNLIEKFATQAPQDLVNLTVLPRVGVTPNEKVFTLYDLELGKLTVFTPREQPQVKEKEVIKEKPKEIVPLKS